MDEHTEVQFRDELRDLTECLRNERKRFAELLAERDAEIARLREMPDVDPPKALGWGWGIAGAAAGITPSKRCADIDLIRREARKAAIEEVLAAVENKPPCPFEKPNRLKPEEPCPVCGDTGEFGDKPSNCSSPMIAIRALAAKSRTNP